VWLLGSFSVLSLLYRSPAPIEAAAEVEDQAPAGESKRERARAAYTALVAAGQPVTGARLAEAAGVSASYGRALLAEFQADPTLAGQGNGQRPGAVSSDDLARIRRIIPALLRKAAATSFPMRRPPAGSRPRPCAPSTASSAVAGTLPWRS
jgi:hypothetical protein